MATQFFQLRTGDSFILQGISYMKLNQHATLDGFPFNARENISGNYRWVLPFQVVTPVDEYFVERITPIDAAHNRVDT